MLTLRRSRSERRAVRGAAAEAIGIPNPESRLSGYPHQFSGGMRQRGHHRHRAGGGPEALIIADEPTTALDVTIQAQILKLK